MEEKKILNESLLDNASAGTHIAEAVLVSESGDVELIHSKGSLNPARRLSDAEAESAAAGVYPPLLSEEIPMASRVAGANEEALKAVLGGAEARPVAASLPVDFGFDPLGLADDPNSIVPRSEQFDLAPEVL